MTPKLKSARFAIYTAAATLIGLVFYILIKLYAKELTSISVVFICFGITSFAILHMMPSFDGADRDIWPKPFKRYDFLFFLGSLYAIAIGIAAILCIYNNDKIYKFIFGSVACLPPVWFLSEHIHYGDKLSGDEFAKFKHLQDSIRNMWGIIVASLIAIIWRPF